MQPTELALLFPTPSLRNEPSLQVIGGMTLMYNDSRFLGFCQAQLQLLVVQYPDGSVGFPLRFTNEKGNASDVHGEWLPYRCDVDNSLTVKAQNWHCLGSDGVASYGGREVTLVGQYVQEHHCFYFEAQGPLAGIVFAKAYCTPPRMPMAGHVLDVPLPPFPVRR